MSLEEEIRQQLTTFLHEPELFAKYMLDQDADPVEIVRAVLSRLRRVEQAVIRLAAEIDAREEPREHD